MTIHLEEVAALRAPVAVTISRSPVDYEAALQQMEAWVEDIRAGRGPERLWLLEHPPLYTAGTSSRDTGLRPDAKFPVYQTRRGGQHTYHGPGQRVAYVMLDLSRRKPDVRAFVRDLEDWLIRALDEFGVRGEIRPDRVGVWVDRSVPDAPREDKIAAIGVRIRRWVSFHGIALNVEPDLSHFDGIVPCGIDDPRYGVTSLVDLGRPVTMDEVDTALLRQFREVFGPLDTSPAPTGPGAS